MTCFVRLCHMYNKEKDGSMKLMVDRCIEDLSVIDSVVLLRDFEAKVTRNQSCLTVSHTDPAYNICTSHCSGPGIPLIPKIKSLNANHEEQRIKRLYEKLQMKINPKKQIKACENSLIQVTAVNLPIRPSRGEIDGSKQRTTAWRNSYS
ncbi:hypothetical protein LguiA_025713 [Lonicera macranthoides]